jgi:starvation-inducible outer membrane lipoprotein
MPRRLGTLLAALALALAGCDSSPAPGNHPDASTDASYNAGNASTCINDYGNESCSDIMSGVTPASCSHVC